MVLKVSEINDPSHPKTPDLSQMPQIMSSSASNSGRHGQKTKWPFPHYTDEITFCYASLQHI